jgi:hypothetical protein
MKSTAIAIAAVGCAMAAMAAGASAAKNPVPAQPGPATPGKSVPAAPAGILPTPKHYTVVTAGPFTANTGTQTRGLANCPIGTVLFGGGAVTPSTDLNVNLNSSFPETTTTWAADMNNVSGGAVSFNVYAVCGKAPRNYQIVESGAFTAPIDGQGSGVEACPAHTKVLGGGSLSNSGSVAVNINSTLPITGGWRTDQNNNTSPSSTFEVFAICGKGQLTYSIQSGTPVANNPFSQTESSVACPAGTNPLSGGEFSSSGSPAVDLNSTLPVSGGWVSYEDNTALINGATTTAYAICE